MDEFQDRIVLITGASGGLGKSVTSAFLKAGATVVGVARSLEQSAFLSERFTAMPADLLNGEAAQTLVNATVERFQRIDVAVHLMGGFAGGALVDETDDATFDRMLGMNLKSAFYVARAVLPRMRKAGYGRFLAVGSRTAVDPQANVAAYSASKAALVSLVQAIALENKEFGITANVVLPGTIDTAVNRAAMPGADWSKWILPEQIADLLVWLGSGKAAQITGAAIPVYGRQA
jgi:NAD(P)-dependent dehydrogenase (short-subunit alcohol dehydrogenase family)